MKYRMCALLAVLALGTAVTAGAADAGFWNEIKKAAANVKRAVTTPVKQIDKGLVQPLIKLITKKKDKPKPAPTRQNPLLQHVESASALLAKSPCDEVMSRFAGRAQKAFRPEHWWIGTCSTEFARGAMCSLANMVSDNAALVNRIANTAWAHRTVCAPGVPAGAVGDAVSVPMVAGALVCGAMYYVTELMLRARSCVDRARSIFSRYDQELANAFLAAGCNLAGDIAGGMMTSMPSGGSTLPVTVIRVIAKLGKALDAANKIDTAFQSLEDSGVCGRRTGRPQQQQNRSLHRASKGKAGKRKASKRKANKRKANKRKANKRKAGKRKASKRKASKRKASKRKASKPKASKRKVSRLKVSRRKRR